MIRFLAAAVLAAAALTACAGSPPPSAAGPAAPASPASAAAASPTAAPPTSGDRQVVTLTVTGGQVSGDTGRVRVPLGASVLLRVTSDVADEIHVHGVDAYIDLVPGGTAEREFVASTPGVFEVELHDAGTVLTRLQVQ